MPYLHNCIGFLDITFNSVSSYNKMITGDYDSANELTQGNLLKIIDGKRFIISEFI